MARPDCPRCGSDLTVAAPSDAPSELVMELRGENVPISEPGVLRWLCRSCGLRWDPAAYADLRLWDADDRPGPDDAPSEAGSASDGGPHEGPGTALRRARHAAGRTIADVSRATGVWERHLMALEDDAPLEEFPARSYARLYLREYAQHLGLDPESLLDALDAVHPAPEEQVLEPLPDRRGRRKVLAVVLVALSVVALALIVLNRPESPAGLQSHVPPPADRAPGAAGSNPDESAAPAPPARELRGIRVEVKVTQRSWVQAISDGEVVAAASFEPGKTATYRAKKALELTLGNAGGVRVRVDGERIATGGPGDVVTLDFRWRDGALSMARA